ncbi:MAG: C25 family cysteine peptidase, partial [Candidatus Thermoplasmatota archaeon]
IEYETNTDKEWFYNFVIGATDTFQSSDTLSEPYEGEELGNYIQDNYMRRFNPIKLYEKELSLSTRSLTDAINCGPGFVLLSDHGGANQYHELGWGWYNSTKGDGLIFSLPDAENLKNENRLPVFVVDACLGASFDNEINPERMRFKESLVEPLLFNKNGGAIAYIGGTGRTYGDYGTTNLAHYSAFLISSFFSGYALGYGRVGNALDFARKTYIDSIGVERPKDYITVIEYNLFGDPTLSIGGMGLHMNLRNGYNITIFNNGNRTELIKIRANATVNIEIKQNSYFLPMDYAESFEVRPIFNEYNKQIMIEAIDFIDEKIYDTLLIPILGNFSYEYIDERNWTTSPTKNLWHISSRDYKSYNHSWWYGDENLNEYTDLRNDSLLLQVYISSNLSVILSFWQNYSFEYNYDFGIVEVLSESKWIKIASYTGLSSWQNEKLNISKYVRENENAYIKFRVYTDARLRAQGWYIDDVSVLDFYDDIENEKSNWTILRKEENLWHLEGKTWCAYDIETGNYTSNSDNSLLSQRIYVKGIGTKIFFRQKYSFEGSRDWGYIELSNDSIIWKIIFAFTGSKDWEYKEIDITKYVSKYFWLRFRLSSGSEKNLEGWYIDGFAVLTRYLQKDVGISELKADEIIDVSKEIKIDVSLKNYAGTKALFPIYIKFGDITAKSLLISLEAFEEKRYEWQIENFFVFGKYKLIAEIALDDDNIVNNFMSIEIEIGRILFYDGFESGQWENESLMGTVWSIANYTSFKGEKCYALAYKMPNTHSSIISKNLDLTSSVNAKLIFYQKLSVESFYDFAYIDIFFDNKWQSLRKYTGISNFWEKVEIELNNYTGKFIKIRFTLTSDNYISESGWYIDEFYLIDEKIRREVILKVENERIELLPGSNKSFAINIHNLGNVDEFLNLRSTSKSLLLEKNNITVPSRKSIPIYAKFFAEKNETFCESFAQIIAENEYIIASISLILVIKKIYGIELVGDEKPKKENDTYIFYFEIINHGNFFVNASLNAIINVNWSLSYEKKFYLEPKEKRNSSIFLREGIAKAYDKVKIRLIAIGENGELAEEEFSIIVDRKYALEFMNITSNFQSGLPGDSLVYIYEIKNNGNYYENFCITISTNSNWQYSLLRTYNGTIEIDKEIFFSIIVFIPINSIAYESANFLLRLITSEKIYTHIIEARTNNIHDIKINIEKVKKYKEVAKYKIEILNKGNEKVNVEISSIFFKKIFVVEPYSNITYEAKIKGKFRTGVYNFTISSKYLDKIEYEDIFLLVEEKKEERNLLFVPVFFTIVTIAIVYSLIRQNRLK